MYFAIYYSAMGHTRTVNFWGVFIFIIDLNNVSCQLVFRLLMSTVPYDEYIAYIIVHRIQFNTTKYIY
jgi:hypothetical protein